MANNLRNVVYLTEEQYKTLYQEGTVSNGSTTIVYSPNDLYLVPDALHSIAYSGDYRELINKPTFINKAATIGTSLTTIATIGGVDITAKLTHQAIKTIKTDATTSQTASSSEAIAGSGTITLHKISKTGLFSDLVSKPTTLSGYGITDAKIANGVITLGANSITPLTSHQSVSNKGATLSWGSATTVATIGSTDIKVSLPADPTTGLQKIKTIGDNLSLANDGTLSAIIPTNYVESAAISGNTLTLTPHNGESISFNNTTYSSATSAVLGLIKVGAVRNSAITSTTGSTTSGRYYGVELDSNGKAFVNVPWQNDNTDTKVNVTLGTTTKAYLLATSTTPTSTTTGVTSIADTGVYLDTTAGRLAATSFSEDGTLLSEKYAAKSHSHSNYLTAHPTISVADDTTSSASPAHGGNFTVIDSVTRDANGHVTKVNTKTITLPGDSNTDTKVTQSYSTTNNKYPLLMTATAGNTSTSSRGDTTSILNNNIYANPSNGYLYASKLYEGTSAISDLYAAKSHTHDYAASGHTHTTSLDVDSGTSSLTLSYGGKYKLSAGGTSVIFTMPSSDSSKLSLSGGAMTGNISYQGSKSTNAMIKFKDNSSDANGNGIAIGGGGIVIIGAGESSDLAYGSAGDENLYLAADTSIHFYSNTQDGLSSAKHMIFANDGSLSVPGAITSNGTAVSLAGHTHNYAGSSSAGGAANSVKTSLTFNNSGSGASSGTTFNGSEAKTISYNTIGAASASHNHDSAYDAKGSASNALSEAKTYAKGLVDGIGQVLKFKGVKSSESAITGLTSADVGDMWINSADGSEWVCKVKVDGTASASSWERLGNASGTVIDSNYKHITVTSSSVSDGTNTFTKYSHPTATAVSAAAVKVGKDALGHVVLGNALTASDVGAATSGHTHDLTLAGDSGTATVTLSANTTYKLTAGGNTLIFKTPTDTNTHNSHIVYSGVKSDGTTNIASDSSSGNITLGNSGATAGSYGDSAAQTPTYGATFKVPYITVNAKGIITGISEHTVKIPASDNTNTATAADNILDGSNSGTQITYAPYASQQSKLSFDTSTTNPTRTDRLNLNGYLYATKLYSGGTEVSVVGHTHDYAASGHTHDLALATDSGTASVTLAHNTTYKLTAGGKTLIFKTPTDSNTDTKVTQAYSTGNANYPLLMSVTSGISSTDSRGATTSILNNQLYANPSTGALYAKVLYENGTALSSLYAAKSHSHSNYLTAHPTISTETDTTSTASPTHGGTFTVIDSVTRDTNGHVTTVNTKTITLPADSNTNYYHTRVYGTGLKVSTGTGVSDMYIPDASTTQKGVTQYTAANLNTWINQLSTGDSVPVDADYFISQYVGGGTSTTTFHRRPISKIFDYVKGKLSISSSNNTAQWGSAVVVGTVGGTELKFTMPNNPDNNTAHSHSAGVGLTGSGTAGTSGTYSYKVNLVNETAASNAATYEAGGTSKFYAVQLDKNNKLGVYVPWTDTDTNTHNSHKINSGLKSDGTTNIVSASASSGDITLGDSGVTAGTYKRVTVNAKGIVIGGDNTDSDTHYTKYLDLKTKVGSTETSVVKFTQDGDKTIKFVQGSNVTLTPNATDGTITIAASDTDTKVTAVGNHYTPSGGSAISVTSSGTATRGSTVVLTGITKDAAGHITGVTASTLPASDNTDTKNTAGGDDTSSKIFLVGMTAQTSNNGTARTYTQDTAYVGTDGCLYSNGTKVSVEGHTHSYAATSHTHGNVTNDGKITASAVTSGAGIVVVDSNNVIQKMTSAANMRTLIGAGTSNLAIGTTSSTAAAGNHAHGNITNTGTITSTAVTSASGVLVYDSSNKIQRMSMADILEGFGVKIYGTSSSFTIQIGSKSITFSQNSDTDGLTITPNFD